MSDSTFLYRDLPLINKRVHRIGLALNYGIDGAGVKKALDLGLNYILWTKFRKGEQHEVIKEALKRDRERMVFAGGAPLAYIGRSVRRGAEKLLRSFDIEYLDIFQLFWLGKMSALSAGVKQELQQLKDEGLVRAVGTSIHNRPRAGRLAAEGELDLLMIRYNAAHPGAEQDIFPSFSQNRPITVAYTATSWRSLLRRPKGWTGNTMTPGHCYRFCLSSPHVDVTLCGPKTIAQLEENLAALGDGPLTSEEEGWIRSYGEVVHG